jgi:hypothetical protein
MSQVHPEDLLAAADRLLATPLRGSDGQWPRACALLIRLALETTLDEYWERTEPTARLSTMRAQLLLLPLPRFAGPEAARLARESWLGLSRAAHHHAYELAPTAAELRRWHTNVTQLAGMLSGHF